MIFSKRDHIIQEVFMAEMNAVEGSDSYNSIFTHDY